MTETVTAQKAAQAITVTTHAPASGRLQHELHGRGQRRRLGERGHVLEPRCLLELRRDVHDDERHRHLPVKYDQAGDANYSAAPQVTETVIAQKAEPDDHRHDARAGERGLQHELPRRGNGRRVG